MASDTLRILVIGDDRKDFDLVQQCLDGAQIDLEWESSYNQAVTKMSQNHRHALLIDYSFNKDSGLTLLHKAQEAGCNRPAIILTQSDDQHHIDLENITQRASGVLAKDRMSPSSLEHAIRTAIVRHEEALEWVTEKERLLVSMASIGEGVLITDAEGSILYMNRAAEEITSSTLDNVRGKQIVEAFCCLNPEAREELTEKVRQTVLQNQIEGRHQDTLIIDRFGSDIVIERKCEAIRDRDGKTIGVVVILRDITEEHLLEKERLRSGKLESLGQLAGGLAHDFNNLLGAILGNVQLARRSEEPEKTDVYLGRAEQASLRARDLTRQLLAFAKGRQPIKYAIDVEAVIQECADLSLTGSKATCRISSQPGLPPVDGDEGQLCQVFNNVFINSAQAMPDGGEVSVTLVEYYGKLPNQDDPGRFVKISIADEGTGLDPADLDRVFDPYFTTKGNGSGLGLATAYAIVKSHQGYITLRSNFGPGITTHIYLPVSEEKVRRRASPKVKLGEQGGRILIVDDEEIVREFIVEALRKSGFQAAGTADASAAIDMYCQAQNSSEPYDAVVMDLTIPGSIGGKEAMEELRKRDPLVKALVSSGYCDDPVMADYKNYGFSGVLVKPYSITELHEALSKLLRGDGNKPEKMN